MRPSDAPDNTRRLAECLAALSLATDLGIGHPLEKGLRTTLLAVGLARRAGLPEATLSDVYYVALLVHAGCTATAHEYRAGFGGDDLEVRRRLLLTPSGPPADTLRTVLGIATEGVPALFKPVAVARVLTNPRAGEEILRAQCEAAELIARKVLLPDRVASALHQVYERWDGRGSPDRLRGEAIAPAVRCVQVAHDTEVLVRAMGLEAALGELRRRERAGGYDPSAVAAMNDAAGELFSSLPEDDLWVGCMAAEPGSQRRVTPAEIDSVVEGIGQFADLKCSFTAGHSAGVADLAHDAALAAGSGEEEAVTLRRAGHLHDVGRTGISNAVWEKPGRLSDSELERVRLHAYYTERVLAKPGALAPLAGLAAAHHERLDGSGYHRGIDSGRLSFAARILAAADAYQAMTQVRPHRPALDPASAARELRSEVEAGRLDGRAVAAVLEGAGHRSGRRASAPGGLSEREVEVVRLICAGRTNREIASTLYLSAKTVGRHVENIYGKTGVHSRASLTLFALQAGVLEPAPRPSGRAT